MIERKKKLRNQFAALNTKEKQQHFDLAQLGKTTIIALRYDTNNRRTR